MSFSVSYSVDQFNIANCLSQVFQKPALFECRIHAAEQLIAQGDLELAEIAFRHALIGVDHEKITGIGVMRAQRQHGDILLRLGRLDEATVAYQCAIRHQRTDNMDTTAFEELLTAAAGLAQVLLKKGHTEQAKTLLRSNLAIMIRHLGHEHPATLRGYADLAALLHESGDFEKACEILTLTSKQQLRMLGAEHEHTQETLARLASTLEVLGQNEQAIAIRNELNLL